MPGIFLLYRLMTQRSRNKQADRLARIAGWDEAENKTEAEWETIREGNRLQSDAITAMMSPEQRDNMLHDNEEFEAMLRKAHAHDHD